MKLTFCQKNLEKWMSYPLGVGIIGVLVSLVCLPIFHISPEIYQLLAKIFAVILFFSIFFNAFISVYSTYSSKYTFRVKNGKLLGVFLQTDDILIGPYRSFYPLVLKKQESVRESHYPLSFSFWTKDSLPFHLSLVMIPYQVEYDEFNEVKSYVEKWYKLLVNNSNFHEWFLNHENEIIDMLQKKLSLCTKEELHSKLHLSEVVETFMNEFNETHLYKVRFYV